MLGDLSSLALVLSSQTNSSLVSASEHHSEEKVGDSFAQLIEEGGREGGEVRQIH
jgi:hypothetical protein